MKSLKEQRKENKDKKIMKQIARGAKQSINLSKFEQEKLVKNQYTYRQRLAYAPIDKFPTFSESELIQRHEMRQSQIENLVYNRNVTESITYWEITIRQAKLIACLLRDISEQYTYDLAIDDCKQAEQALMTAINPDGSPNQRRKKFVALYHLNEIITIFESALSQDVIGYLAQYNKAIQVCAYLLIMYQQDIDDMVSMMQVIGGTSIREIAKDRGIKESELKARVLHVSKPLYRIGQMKNKDITPAKSIPDLRSPAWKEISSFDALANLGKESMHEVVMPFTKMTGVDLLNLREYNKRISEVQLNLFRTH